MSRYKSEQTAYSPLKKKYVPLWKLDTNTVTVTHFNADTQTDSCYQKAILAGDTKKMIGLENCFISMAREAVFDCMVYI